jgi:hypothetical protein
LGTCTIHFNQIEIINKKSDTAHTDSDWMIVHWFTNSGLKQSHTFPLTNTAGSTFLNSGQLLQPVSLQMSCPDSELVTVVFQIVNLGSFDAGEQAAAVTKIAQKGAEAFAAVYMEAVQFVVANSGLPLAGVFADGLDELTPAIVDSVGAAFEDVITPVISELADIIAGIFGRPNCNGDVLHDVVFFMPSQPWPPLSLSRVYTASAVSGCGGPAKTAVQLTIERWLDAVPLFPPGPAPKVETSPGIGVSADAWQGTWAEDPYTVTPKIIVRINRSLAASGTYKVEVEEFIDRRFDIKFEAEKDVLTPKEAALPPVGGDIFGALRPSSEGGLTRAKLAPIFVQTTDAGSGGAGMTLVEPLLSQTTYVSTEKGLVEAPQARPAISFKLEWEMPVELPQPGPPVPGAQVDLGQAVVQPEYDFTTLMGYEKVPIFDLPEFGVRLGLYAFKHNGQVIGYGVRYMRFQNWHFTKADVMLVKWSPVG